jgi:hypothetical protein
MRELHGVVQVADDSALPRLKQRALIFDKLYVMPSFELIYNFSGKGTPEESQVAIHAFDQQAEVEIEYLKEKGLAADVPKAVVDQATNLGVDSKPDLVRPEMLQIGGSFFISEKDDGANKSVADWYIRNLSAHLAATLAVDTVPICESQFPEHLPKKPPASCEQTVLSVAMDFLPLPSESCAWEDILAFKSELSDKLWTFRRFLSTLTTKTRTEAEIRDDLEWMVNEYSNAMKIHKIKSSMSFVEVFVLGIADVAQSLITHDWAKLTKGALSIKKRQVELLEAEMKSPGRECA